MKRLIVFAVLFGILGLGPAIDAAQGPHPGAGPVVDDERMGQKECPGAVPSAAPSK